MPSFQADFEKSLGAPITYKGKQLHIVDRIPIPRETVVQVRVLTTNSEWKQGIISDTKGSFAANGVVSKKGIVLWEDTMPSTANIKVRSQSGELVLRNAWQRPSWDGKTVTESWVHGAAMIIEEIPNGRRYYCNDGHPDENFDDIVFEIVVLPQDSVNSK